MLRYHNYDIVCQEIPDEITLAVNITDCPMRCPGCHSPWLWEDAGRVLDEAEVDALLSLYGSAVTCFGLMGGDGSPEEVMQLARHIRQSYPHIRTAWYSGREELPDCWDAACMDYVKTGPFVEALGGLRSATTNQRLYRIENGQLVPIKIQNN